LRQILAPFEGITMGHHLIKDFGGAVLDGAHEGEEHPILDTAPRVMLMPVLAFTRVGVIDLAPGQGAEWQTVPGRLMPPARPGQGKPPQHCFVFVEQDDRAALGAIFEGGECEGAIGQVGGLGLQTSSRAAIS
jgi:hypothetical protein